MLRIKKALNLKDIIFKRMQKVMRCLSLLKTKSIPLCKNSKKADDDDSAYKPAPCDKSAKTKPSTYTKQFKKMFDEDPCWDTHKQVGMKKKGGKMVPNCVPKNEDLDSADKPVVKGIIKKLKGASKKHAQQCF